MQQDITGLHVNPCTSLKSASMSPIPDRAEVGMRIVLTGEPMCDKGMVVWARLKALRGRRHQLSVAAMIKRLLIWREWNRNHGSYANTALSVGMYYRRGRSRQHIYYIIQRMKKDGILVGLSVNDSIANLLKQACPLPIRA